MQPAHNSSDRASARDALLNGSAANLGPYAKHYRHAAYSEGVSLHEHVAVGTATNLLWKESLISCPPPSRALSLKQETSWKRERGARKRKRATIKSNNSGPATDRAVTAA
jgi:hypothetical protein